MSEFRVTRGGDYTESDYLAGGNGQNLDGDKNIRVYVSNNDGWLAQNVGTSSVVLGGYTGGGYYQFNPMMDGLYADLRANTLKVSIQGGVVGDYLMAGSGDDVLDGGDGNDQLYGYDGKDTLSGGIGNDILDGGAGDDVLDGGAGNDSFIGGDGIDTVSYASATGAVTLKPYAIDPGDGVQYGVNVAGQASGDTFQSIENFTGSNFNDTLTGNDDSTVNVLSGLGGNDTITLGTGDTGNGGDGDDRISLGFGAIGVTVDGGANTDAGDTFSGTLLGEEQFVLGATGLARGDTVVATITGIENYFFTAFQASTNKLSIGAVTGSVNLNFISNGLISIVDASNTVAGTTVRFSGGNGADTYIGGAGQDEITFSDTGLTVVNLTGSTKTVGGVDYAAGTALDGTGAIDSITGPIDRLSVGSSAGNTVYLGDNGARVDAGSGADLLVGGAGRDYLYGQGGDDTLIGGTGYDWFDGGDGTDTVSYADSATFVKIDLVAYYDNDGEAANDRHFSIENLIGTGFNDTLVGNASANVLIGGAGNDTLRGGAGADRLDGGDGLDNLSGGDGNDVLLAGVGADVLDGGAGDDRFVVNGAFGSADGGDGTDTLLVQSGSVAASSLANIERVVVAGDASLDLSALQTGDFGVIRSQSSAGHAATINGTQGADTIAGGAGEDTLYGEGGNDLISLAQMATIDGGAGDADTLSLKLATGSLATFTDETLIGVERVIVGAGIDFDASQVSTALTITGSGGQGRDLSGGSAADLIRGSAGSEYLYGNGGDDTIKGGNGGDHISGGAGADRLFGENGADIFVFDKLGDLAGTGNAVDRIMDFSSHDGDKIDFTSLDANGDVSDGVQHFTFIGTDAFSRDADAFEVRVKGAGPNLTLQFDTNHDGVADYSMIVHSTQALTTDDFLGITNGVI